MRRLSPENINELLARGVIVSYADLNPSHRHFEITAVYGWKSAYVVLARNSSGEDYCSVQDHLAVPRNAKFHPPGLLNSAPNANDLYLSLANRLGVQIAQVVEAVNLAYRLEQEYQRPQPSP
jgi:hypothetical protein